MKMLISDLHLDENNPFISQLFLKFLKEAANSAEALYILGDFFEVWIGDDYLSEFNLSIMNNLKSATEKGLAIYITQGNRDFLLGRQFFKYTGCQLLPDEFVTDIYGKKTLLMHGDSLCLGDPRYIYYRKIIRHSWIKKLFLLLPLKKRLKIADKMRNSSKMHNATLVESILDVTPSEVMRIMNHYQVQHLIHGHTHKKAIHTFLLEGKISTRTVLGDWHTQGSVLICKSDGSQELITL